VPDFVYRLDHVEKSYKGRSEPALSLGEAVEIERGEVLVVVGPSGAGKSTLLRLLALSEPPDQGIVECLGVHLDIRARPPLALRRRIALVFQRPILLSRSVAANVAYGLHIRGDRHVTAKVEKALVSVGLERMGAIQARTLSGGEAQRVALARALVLEPDVLLLDEPTANLDPFNVGLIEQIIRSAHSERQTTVVLVTHNVFQARRLASRVGLLLSGKLIEIGAPAEFFEHPHDPRTGAFVRGEMVY
jgi:tungstate transport system ATP-binding protein